DDLVTGVQTCALPIFALISWTRAPAVIPGQSRTCFTLEGFLPVMDCSALSADDHVPSHNAPVLDLDSGSHLLLQVLIVRHGRLRSAERRVGKGCGVRL